jgi:hypothetical protein
MDMGSTWRTHGIEGEREEWGIKEGGEEKEGREELLTIMSCILKCLLIVNYQQVLGAKY